MEVAIVHSIEFENKVVTPKLFAVKVDSFFPSDSQHENETLLLITIRARVPASRNNDLQIS